MRFASLRNPVLITAGALVAVLVAPLGASTALAPASAATVPTGTSVHAAIAPPTAAQLAAAKKLAAANKIKARKAAKARRARAAQARIVRRGNKIVKVAARYKGRPYVYGASGPRAFDCSGYTSFVVRHALHVSLPHNAAAQAHSRHVIRVSKSHRKVGDLVFFRYGGSIGHVAIYAGNGMIWSAPHTGSHVRKQKIFSSSVSYGRIR